MVAETGATTDRLLNKLAYAAFNKASALGAIAADDRILVMDTSADGAVTYATPAQVGALQAIVNVPDATTYTVLAADSGKVHILPNFTSTCTITLPTAAAGLAYTFLGKAVAADAQNWVFTAITPSFYLGGIVWHDADNAADNTADLYPNGSSHLTFTITAPMGGSVVYLICDGTNWIINGQAVAIATPAFS